MPCENETIERNEYFFVFFIFQKYKKIKSFTHPYYFFKFDIQKSNIEIFNFDW